LSIARQSSEFAAATLSTTSSRVTHIFLCPFHAACWHSALQYEACLQREQRLSAARCFPHCEQLIAFTTQQSSDGQAKFGRRQNLKDLHLHRKGPKGLLDTLDPLLHSERTQGFTADPDYWKGEVFVYVGQNQNLKDLILGARRT
jgi:hypothetical protein